MRLMQRRWTRRVSFQRVKLSAAYDVFAVYIAESIRRQVVVRGGGRSGLTLQRRPLVMPLRRLFISIGGSKAGGLVQRRRNNL